MTLEQIRELHRAQPFKPFTLNLADGQSVPIAHPEYLAVLGQGRTIIVGSPESEGFKIIDLLLVTSADVPATRRASSGGSNGHRKPKR